MIKLVSRILRFQWRIIKPFKHFNRKTSQLTNLCSIMPHITLFFLKFKITRLIMWYSSATSMLSVFKVKMTIFFLNKLNKSKNHVGIKKIKNALIIVLNALLPKLLRTYLLCILKMNNACFSPCWAGRCWKIRFLNINWYTMNKYGFTMKILKIKPFLLWLI